MFFSAECARFGQGDRHVELLGIEGDGAVDLLGELGLDQLPQDVGFGSDGEAQAEGHGHGRRVRRAAQPRSAPVQGDLVADHRHRRHSLAPPSLIELLQLQQKLK